VTPEAAATFQLRPVLARLIARARKALAEASRNREGLTFLQAGYFAPERDRDRDGRFIVAGHLFRGTALENTKGLLSFDAPGYEFRLDEELARALQGPVKGIRRELAAGASASDRYLLDCYDAAVGALAALRVRKDDSHVHEVRPIALEALHQADAKLMALRTILASIDNEPVLRAVPANARTTVDRLSELLKVASGATPIGEPADPALIDQLFERVQAGSYSVLPGRSKPHLYAPRPLLRGALRDAGVSLDSPGQKAAWLADILDEVLAPIQGTVAVVPGLGSADVARQTLANVVMRTQVKLRVVRTWLDRLESDRIGSDFGRPESEPTIETGPETGGEVGS
jgi:hypothetical protein